MTYAEEKAGRLKNLLYGMNKVGSHEEVLQTITDAFEEALQAQREAHIEAIKQFAREGHAASAEAIIQAILNAEVTA